MTDHDPRPPTDDELREWRSIAAGGAQNGFGLAYDIDKRMIAACDALLSERAAHLATKAENAKLRTVADAAAEWDAATNAQALAALNRLPEGEFATRWPEACAREVETREAIRVAVRALADPEEPHK